MMRRDAHMYGCGRRQGWIGTALAAVLASSAALGAAPLERNVQVADVTPAAFTVVWTVGEAATGTVQVYDDVLGTVPAAGVVIEPGFSASGHPAVATAAEDLGILRVRVRGLEENRPYFFRTSTTAKAGGPAQAVPASGALFSTVTASASLVYEARGFAAGIAESDGTTPATGALLLVEVPGALSPLSALAGDGYADARAALSLSNLYETASGESLLTTGGEIATVTALGGFTGRASASQALAANDGSGTQQFMGTLVLGVEVDTDLDGMPDAFESAHGLNPAANDATGDLDLDGLSNFQEYRRGTDPGVADSDGDGLSDGAEVSTHGTLPTEPDTDRDGRLDGAEIAGPDATDPLDGDSDGDGVGDGDEVLAGTDPNDPQDFPILDGDADGVGDLVDNCVNVPNPPQTDNDLDGLGNPCDGDDDGDGLADGPDNCPLISNVSQDDVDTDTVGDPCDNCPSDANVGQEDSEDDGLGDPCDPDDDNDTVDDYEDEPPPSDIPFEVLDITSIVSTSLPVVSSDTAFVSVGKFFVAESRVVNYGFFDLKDRTYTPSSVSPADQAAPGWLWVAVDTNSCGCFQTMARDTITVATNAGNIAATLPAGAETLGTIMMVSDDGSTWGGWYLPDGPLANLWQSSRVAGPLDNCRFVPNPVQEDSDGDGIGDLCDITADDLDGDNVLNVADNCPTAHNPGQADFDVDGLGDACDPDDDNDGVSDANEIAVLLTDPHGSDTDSDGISDGDEDFDFDGRSNAEEIALGRSPSNPDVELYAGLNFYAYPVPVPGGLSAFDLLPALGGPTQVASVSRFDATAQEFEVASYSGGVPTGVDFTIDASEGYLVEMLVDKVVTYTGQPVCATISIEQGSNLRTFPCVPSGFDAADLLAYLGPPGVVASLQSIDPATGRFETTAWNAATTIGGQVRPAAGRAVFIDALATRNGIVPPLSPPDVVITSPLDGSTTDTTPAPIAGTIDPPDAIVAVNGVLATLDGNGGFSALVPLAEGPNTVTAVARTTDNLAASTSISVTLDTSVPVDYTLDRPDSVADSRAFNVGAGVLATLHHFHVQLVNLPSGVTFAPGSISYSPSSGNVTAPFTISTSGSAAVGVHTFQAIYQFHDASHTELASHTMNFTIEVLP